MSVCLLGSKNMQEKELETMLKLAMEADSKGNYKSADEIDNFIKEAQNPLQNWTRNQIRRLRGLGDESGRARRQIRNIERGPNTVDRMRSQPTFEEALGRLDDGRNISGHNPMKLRSNSAIVDRIINALQPTYRQIMTKRSEFPRLYREWETTYNRRMQELKTSLSFTDDELGDYLRTHPEMRENLVGPLENQLVSMRNSHVDLINRTIDQVCDAYDITRSPENLNVIKARIASDRNLRGFLYDNSFTTDRMIEQVLTSNNIPIRSYLTNMGPWKRSMSPAVAGLLFLSAGAAGGAALKGMPKSKPEVKPLPSKSPESPIGKLENELEADRRGTGLFDTPIATIEKYLKRKKENGSIKPGITKQELYNMAKIDLGEHIANNLIQYVMSKFGFKMKTNAPEKDFEVNLF